MSAPPGAVVKLAPYDWGVSRHRQEPPPSDGDILVTEGAKGYGTAYVILDARLMARSAVPGRYALTCRVLGPAASVDLTGERVLVIRWYPRNRSRR
ncbi:MAG: hypothetical protein AB7P40_00030 [Chloroflexota bacterium]